MRDADVRLDRVRKTFGAVIAVNDVTLDIERGTIFSLLGPSGCGKTTTLRLIAGFEQPSAGEVYIRGKRVTSIAPYRRDFSMVFQSYALFPHLSVAENVAFGLRMRRVPRAERGAAIKEALELVKLGALADRYPRQLSGGQQQRVALARAIVVKPAVLLLDEPLGALDKMLREEMQVELRDLQQRLGITAVFVTHDQEEALTLSDRVAVMRGGVIEQIGAPREIYDRPVSEFVAGFLGASNFLDGQRRRARGCDRRGGDGGRARACGRRGGNDAGWREGARRSAPGEGADERSRGRRAARQGAQHRLSRTGDALLHGRRRRTAARLCAERGCRRLGGRRRGALRLGCRRRGGSRARASVKGLRNLWAWALLTPPLAAAVVLFVVPLLYLFYISLHAASPSEIYGSTLTLENYTSVLSDGFYLGIIRRTIGTAAAILALCLFIGYPVAYFVALLPTRRRMIVLLLLLFH
jgi:putative spermidine/putrescine transport system ATP-binding protein/spermidine/putrescine transport system ATP-binding protein